MEEVYKELKEKHAAAFDTPKLHLWARMLCSNLHNDLDNPPDVPAFTGSIPKTSRQDSLSDAWCNVAQKAMLPTTHLFIYKCINIKVSGIENAEYSAPVLSAAVI